MTKFTDRQLPPLPPSEPLDDEERALARALRGLPSAAPPPELDARILGASRRAIAITPRLHAHRRGWVWGLSSAAAAVLAVGVLLKMHVQGRDQAIAPASEAAATAQPATSPAGINPAANAADAASAGLSQSAVTDSEPKAADTRASGAAAANAIGTAQPAAKSERDEIKAAKPAVPAPSAAGIVAQLDKSSAGKAATSNAAPQPFPTTPTAARRDAQPASPERETVGAFAKTVSTDQPSYMSTPPPPASVPTAKTQPLPAPLASPSEPAQMQESQNAGAARKDAALDRVEVTGSRLKRALASAELPPLDDDSKLSPTPWLARIRARVNAADGSGARESLRRFSARYPNAQIPADLALLRK